METMNPMSLKNVLLSEPNRTLLIADCATLVSSEVESKSGLSGMAIKGVFKLAKRLRPTFVTDVISLILNDFVNTLESFYIQSQKSPAGSFGQYLNTHSSSVATAFLETTDSHVQRANNRGLQNAYYKLRPTGKKHVESALPGVSDILEKYLP